MSHAASTRCPLASRHALLGRARSSLGASSSAAAAAAAASPRPLAAGVSSRRRQTPRPPVSRSRAPTRCVSTPERSAKDPRARVALDPSVVAVRETTTSGELRASAAARALSFYEYPPDRSEYSVRAHRNMRIDAEWDAIGEKIAGTDVAFKNCRVSCLVAALPLLEDGAAPEGFGIDDGVHPASVARDGDPPPGTIVLGTLDVNQGVTLPAEELAGKFPRDDDPVRPGTDTSQDGRGPGEEKKKTQTQTGDAGDAGAGGTGVRATRYRRAYLSNVCVLPQARRLGLGKRLMRRAMEVAEGWGVEEMYVHVVSDNHGAKSFYEDFGFVVESEETAAFAAGLSRPPRIILRKSVGVEGASAEEASP